MSLIPWLLRTIFLYVGLPFLCLVAVGAISDAYEGSGFRERLRRVLEDYQGPEVQQQDETTQGDGDEMGSSDRELTREFSSSQDNFDTPFLPKRKRSKDDDASPKRKHPVHHHPTIMHKSMFERFKYKANVVKATTNAAIATETESSGDEPESSSAAEDISLDRAASPLIKKSFRTSLIGTSRPRFFLSTLIIPFIILFIVALLIFISIGPLCLSSEEGKNCSIMIVPEVADQPRACFLILNSTGLLRETAMLSAKLACKSVVVLSFLPSFLHERASAMTILDEDDSGNNHVKRMKRHDHGWWWGTSKTWSWPSSPLLVLIEVVPVMILIVGIFSTCWLLVLRSKPLPVMEKNVPDVVESVVISTTVQTAQQPSGNVKDDTSSRDDDNDDNDDDNNEDDEDMLESAETLARVMSSNNNTLQPTKEAHHPPTTFTQIDKEPVNHICEDIMSVLGGEIPMNQIIFRSDPRGCQLPLEVALDAVSRCRVFCLVLTRYAFKRDVVLAEIQRAVECRLPIVLVIEKRASKTNGPKEFRKIVEPLLNDPNIPTLVWDPTDSAKTVAKELLAFKSRHDNEGNSCVWDFYISHTSHRKTYASVQAMGADSLRGALNFLVCNVKDAESTSLLTALIEAQTVVGALAPMDAEAFLDVLARKEGD